MVVRFLLDENQKKEDDILTRINRIAAKADYPSKNTAHLAVFLKSCFDVELEKKLKVLRKDYEAEEFVRKERIINIKRRDEERRLKELESLAPVGPEPIQEVSKKEYALKLYGYPVGVLVDKDREGRYNYKKFEPVVDQNIIDFIELNFGDIIGKDLSILDKKEFIELVAKKVSKKLKVSIHPEDYLKIIYYLKRDAMGAGLVDVLLFDDKVTDITIAGTDKVIVAYGSHGRLVSNIKFKDNDQLNNLIFRIARATGESISEQNPMMNVTFQGFAISATLGVAGSSSRLVMTRL